MKNILFATLVMLSSLTAFSQQKKAQPPTSPVQQSAEPTKEQLRSAIADLSNQVGRLTAYNERLRLEVAEGKIVMSEMASAPSRKERDAVIAEINANNPGYHWDVQKHGLVKDADPNVPKPQGAMPIEPVKH